MELSVPASAGEVIDKITILEIKQERIADAAKRRNIDAELETLRTAWEQALPPQHDQRALARLRGSLAEVNRRLWDIEDAIRDEERNSRFDEAFVRLARSVYIENDERARIKREVNALLGSRLVEEKSYANYQGGGGGR